MSKKDINFKKRRIILGSISVLTVAASLLSVSTINFSEKLPNEINEKSSYFDAAKKAEIKKTADLLGVDKDNYLETAEENQALTQINAEKQFEVLNSGVTIDQLIDRLKRIKTLGLYEFKDSKINSVSVQADIAYLESLKTKATADSKNQSVRNTIYSDLAKEYKPVFIKTIPEKLLTTSDSRPFDLAYKLKLITDYSAIKVLYRENRTLFQDYAADFIKKWIQFDARRPFNNNNSGRFNITLATVNPYSRNNILYSAGSLFGHRSQEAWNNAQGSNVFNNYSLPNGQPVRVMRFPENGTVVYSYPEPQRGILHKDNFTFIKENLTPADFTLFQLLISGFLNFQNLNNRQISEYIVPNRERPAEDQFVTVNVEKKYTDGPGTIRLNTSKYISLTARGDEKNIWNTRDSEELKNEYQAEYFNPTVYQSLRNRLRKIAVLINGVTGDRDYNYDDFYKTNDYPDPLFYLMKARTTDDEIKKIVDKKFDKIARKYYIEKFYAGNDTSKLVNSNLNAPNNDDRTRLQGTQKVNSIYETVIKGYNDVFKHLPLLGNSKIPNSLSFKWFIANKYNKRGNTPFTINRTRAQASTIIDDFKFNRVNENNAQVTDADNILVNATDSMVYAYLNHIIDLNKFDINDSNMKSVFQGLYRLLRSVISLETTLYEAKNSTTLGTSSNSIILNGYSQDKSKPSFSDQLVVKASEVTRHYKNMIEIIAQANKNSIIKFAKTTKSEDLDVARDVFVFFQLFFNPAQFNLDIPDSRTRERMRSWDALSKYIKIHYPNYGLPTFSGSGNSTTVTNQKDTLNGRSLEYNNASDGTLVHAALLRLYKTKMGIGTTETTNEEVRNFAKWLFSKRIKEDIRKIVLDAENTNLTHGTVNIDGAELRVNPKYPFGRLLAAAELTNLAVNNENDAFEDKLIPSDITSANLNTNEIKNELSIPVETDFTKQLNGENLVKVTKKYFSVKKYSEYLTTFNARNTSKKLVPLAPDRSSAFYTDNYVSYLTDYSNYLKAFFVDGNVNGTIMSKIPLPKPIFIKESVSLENTNFLLSTYQLYIKIYQEAAKATRQARRDALVKIIDIPLNQDEEGFYRVTLKNGTTISQGESWTNANGSKKVDKTTNPIVKVELGSNRVLVPLNSPLIKWTTSFDRYEDGIAGVLPGYNFITTNPKNESQKTNVRDILIEKLNDASRKEYKEITGSLTTLFKSLKNYFKADQFAEFNNKIEELKQINDANIVTLDGYNVTADTSIVPAVLDVKRPWDYPTRESRALVDGGDKKEKFAPFLSTAVSPLQNNVKYLRKLRELTITAIKSANSADAVYNLARSKARDFITGIDVLNSAGNVVRKSGTQVKLTDIFPEQANPVDTVLIGLSGLRMYIRGTTVERPTFRDVSKIVTRIKDVELRQFLETELLKYEFNTFSDVKFKFNENSSDLSSINDANWTIKNLTFTRNQQTNLTQYNNHVNSNTDANSPLRFLYLSLSDADSDSSAFVSSRDNAIQAIRDLYTFLRINSSSFSVKYNPATNQAQANIDKTDPGLKGDIANITIDQRYSLAEKYNRAYNSLKIIKENLVSVDSLKKTRDALNYVYANAKKVAGNYNAQGTLVSGSNPYFILQSDATVDNDKWTINTQNEGFKILAAAANVSNSIVNRLSSDKNDYLATLALLSDLVFQEQFFNKVAKQNNYDIAKWRKFEETLNNILIKVNSDFSTVPKYQNANKSSVSFTAIRKQEFKNLLIEKIRFLKYSSGLLYLQNNFVTGLNLNDDSVDPETHNTAWTKKLTELRQQGKSSYSYRVLNDAKKQEVNDVLGAIYSVVRRPNEDSSVISKSSLSSYLPTQANVDRLKTLIEGLPTLSNDISPLQNEYDMIKTLDKSLSISSHVLLKSVFDQSKNFIDINNGVNSENSSFEGVWSTSTDAQKEFVKRAFINQFSEEDIRLQLQKLTNAKSLYNLIKTIYDFRQKYLTIGVNGVVNKKPSDLKNKIPATVYDAWKVLDDQAEKLITSGIVPNTSFNLVNVATSAKTKVNLAPGLDSSGNLIPVSFNALELKRDFSSMADALNKFSSALISATNALDNVVTSERLVPLLNELNGNTSDTYNSNANSDSINNLVYKIKPEEFKNATFNLPRLSTETALSNFNQNFSAIKAFPEASRNDFNNYKYEEFLDAQSSSGKGPISIKKDKSGSQQNVNDLVQYLNSSMTTQLNNAIFWASTDFIILNKMLEFMNAETDSTTTLNDGSAIKQKENSFRRVFEKTKEFFTTELAKPNSEYIKVTGFNSTIDTSTKKPLLNFDEKMKEYNDNWKSLMLRFSMADSTKKTDFMHKGQNILARHALSTSSNTADRAVLIKAFADYSNSRKALDGLNIPSYNSKNIEFRTLFNSKVDGLRSDWETHRYTNPEAIKYQNELKKAKKMIEDIDADKFVLVDNLKTSLQNLTNPRSILGTTITADPVEKPIYTNEYLDGLETGILAVAKKYLEDTNNTNRNAFDEKNAEVNEVGSKIQAEFDKINSLPDTDTTKAKKLADIEAMISKINKAKDVSRNVSNIIGLLNKLTELRRNPNETLLKEITSEVDKSKSTETDPTAISILDSAKIQLNSVKQLLDKSKEGENKKTLDENNIATANETASKLVSENGLEKIKEFVNLVNTLGESTPKVTEDFSRIKPTLDKAVEGIEKYNSSEKNTPEAINEVKKVIDEAIESAKSVIANNNSSDVEKEIAESLLTNLDSRLENLNKISIVDSKVVSDLNKAIDDYSSSPNEENLNFLNEAIKKADGFKVDTAPIKTILEINKDLNDLLPMADVVKSGNANEEAKIELNAKLNEVKDKISRIKKTLDDTSNINDVFNNVDEKLSAVDKETKPFLLSSGFIDLDNKADEILNSNDNLSSSKIDELNEKAIEFNPTSEIETAEKEKLLEKIFKIKNEIQVKDILKNLPSKPNEKEIEKLENLSNNTVNSYSKVIEALKANAKTVADIDNFYKLNSKDKRIPEVVEKIKSDIENNKKYNTDLMSSKNETISNLGAKYLKDSNEMKLAFESELLLYEGLKQNDDKKISLAKKTYEKITNKSYLKNDNEYKKLFEMISDWNNTIDKANDGRLKYLIEAKRIRDNLTEFKAVSNIVRTELDSKLKDFDVENSSSYLITLIVIIASAVIGFTATTLLLLNRRRLKRKNFKK